MPVMFATIKEVIQATPTVCLPRLVTEKPIEYKPGQYVLVFVQRDGQAVVKPYSVASPPSRKDYIELCIRKVGFVSNYMAGLKPGDKLKISGPGGAFTIKPVENDTVFVATGTGISSIIPMIAAIFEKGTDKEVWLFFGNRSEEEIVYRDYFENLAEQHKNFHFVPVLSRAGESWKGERGYVQDALKRHVSMPAGKEIYICGVLAVVEEVAKLAEEMGFEKDNIYFEKYI